MNTKLHLIRREPCEPRVILHKRRHALDLRTNLQQQAFKLSPKTVFPRRVQSQTALWSWHNPPSVLAVVGGGRGLCIVSLSSHFCSPWPYGRYKHTLSTGKHMCTQTECVLNRQNAHTPTQQMPFLSPLSSLLPLLLSYNPTNLSRGHLEGPRRSTMFSSVPTF